MSELGQARLPVQPQAAGDTHIGGRPHNEDAILLRPDLNLFVVADGAGGQNAGNVASSLAVTTVAHFFEQTEARATALPLYDGLGLFTAARRLSTAVQEANREILAIAKTSDRHRGMGTTVVAALLDTERRWLHLAYVGDSRCYRLRDGRLELLSFDHSLINDVLELRPNIDDERVKKLPKNVITRALGMSPNLRVSVRTHELQHGDRYMLCSDGLSDVVTDQQIGEALAMDVGCDEQVEVLMNLALDRQADDNVACVIVDCGLPTAGGKTPTRPLRKTRSRPAIRRVSPSEPAPGPPSPDMITEESVPEIMLYDSVPAARESSPLIHVVPAQSTSDEVMNAVKGVMAPNQPPPRPTPETSRMTSLGVAPAPKRAKPLATPDKPEVEPPIADDMTEVMDDDDEPATMIAARDEDEEPSAEVEAATREFRARMEAKRSSVPSPAARSEPSHTQRPPARAHGEKATSLAAPRRNNPDASAEVGSPRTGDTQRALDSAPPPAVGGKRPLRPPLPRMMRGTIPGAAPPPAIVQELEAKRKAAKVEREQRQDAGKEDRESTAFELKKPVPPMRPPLDTSEFILEENIPCHACGSVIARTAEICMYCGATTGFVTSE
jgi:PPM family protein phosphatase